MPATIGLNRPRKPVHKTLTAARLGRGLLVPSIFSCAVLALSAVLGPHALAQPAQDRPTMGDAGDAAMEARLTGVDCHNGAGRRIADWGLPPRLRITDRGMLVYRWLEYGGAGDGSGWTAMRARARLSELTLDGITTAHNAGECPAVEVFCKVEGCVSITSGPPAQGRNRGKPARQASYLVLHAPSPEAANRIAERLTTIIEP